MREALLSVVSLVTTLLSGSIVTGVPTVQTQLQRDDVEPQGIIVTAESPFWSGQESVFDLPGRIFGITPISIKFDSPPDFDPTVKGSAVGLYIRSSSPLGLVARTQTERRSNFCEWTDAISAPVASRPGNATSHLTLRVEPLDLILQPAASRSDASRDGVAVSIALSRIADSSHDPRSYSDSPLRFRSESLSQRTQRPRGPPREEACRVMDSQDPTEMLGRLYNQRASLISFAGGSLVKGDISTQRGGVPPLAFVYRRFASQMPALTAALGPVELLNVTFRGSLRIGNLLELSLPAPASLGLSHEEASEALAVSIQFAFEGVEINETVRGFFQLQPFHIGAQDDDFQQQFWIRSPFSYTAAAVLPSARAADGTFIMIAKLHPHIGVPFISAAGFHLSPDLPFLIRIMILDRGGSDNIWSARLRVTRPPLLDQVILKGSPPSVRPSAAPHAISASGPLSGVTKPSEPTAVSDEGSFLMAVWWICRLIVSAAATVIALSCLTITVFVGLYTFDPDRLLTFLRSVPGAEDNEAYSRCLSWLDCRQDARDDYLQPPDEDTDRFYRPADLQMSFVAPLSASRPSTTASGAHSGTDNELTVNLTASTAEDCETAALAKFPAYPDANVDPLTLQPYLMDPFDEKVFRVPEKRPSHQHQQEVNAVNPRIPSASEQAGAGSSDDNSIQRGS